MRLPLANPLEKKVREEISLSEDCLLHRRFIAPLDNFCPLAGPIFAKPLITKPFINGVEPRLEADKLSL